MLVILFRKALATTGNARAVPTRRRHPRTYDARNELTGKLNYRVVRWLDKVLTVNSTVSVSSPTRRTFNARKELTGKLNYRVVRWLNKGSTRTYGVRKELTGKSNSRVVMRRLNKGLTDNSHLARRTHRVPH
eukprot:1188453-Prorocentrum_minimum.AAC.1